MKKPDLTLYSIADIKAMIEFCTVKAIQCENNGHGKRRDFYNDVVCYLRNKLEYRIDNLFEED